MKRYYLITTLSLFFLLVTTMCIGQDTVFMITPDLFNQSGIFYLSPDDEWEYKKGNDPAWADPAYPTKDWKKIKLSDINATRIDKNGFLEGWLRLKIQPDSTLIHQNLSILSSEWAASDIYLDGHLINSFGNTGAYGGAFKEHFPKQNKTVPIHLPEVKTYTIAIHFVYHPVGFFKSLRKGKHAIINLIAIASPEYISNINQNILNAKALMLGIFAFAFVLFLLFWLLYLQNKKEDHLLYLAITVTCISGGPLLLLINLHGSALTQIQSWTLEYISGILVFSLIILFPLTIAKIFTNKIHRLHWLYSGILLILTLLQLVQGYTIVIGAIIISSLISVYYVITSWKKLTGSKWVIAVGLLASMAIIISIPVLVLLQMDSFFNKYGQFLMLAIFLVFPISLVVYISVWFKDTLLKVKETANHLIKITEEKKEILANQNIQLEQQVAHRTAELNESMEHLKSTQAQLIQSEKMASLGELTAGIAHEIQNPLNFVNNFSDVNTELITELHEAAAQGDLREVMALVKDIKENEEKIMHHGKRADAIVKGMLQHSRASGGTTEPTDINALADEYLRLAYHGLRAKDKSFNATMRTDFDPSIGKVNVIPQDIGRVILNLITNAFYAVSEKKNSGIENYDPTVNVRTKNIVSSDGKTYLEISVQDNGHGMPKSVMDKIFQPFFTTKPTGQGTGLGLSLSYDIVKAHGGELKVQTDEGKGSVFTIRVLPS